MNTYTKKQLALTVTLGAGQFGADLGDTVTLTGFRMTADTSDSGGESMGMCQLRVYGMLNETMNKLTTIGQINRAIRTKNSILLAAGDDESGMQTVFQGTIFDAWADYNSAPDVAFNIIAYSGLDLAVKPVNATSYKGAADVATIMQGFANDAGLILENNSVNVQLSNPYFSGTTLNKIRTCARAANILQTIDRGVLAIWPKTGSRVGEIPTISKDTGMVGYPSLSSKGMTIKTLFNFNIKLGGRVSVQSFIPMACGMQRVSKVTHSLSCQVPGGPWFTTMDLYNVSGQ
jgi:hypothetical protein